METRSVPLNRTTVGLIALGCLAATILLEPWTQESSNLTLWQAALGRVGIVMAALWLAMPGRNQPAAWANLSPRFLGFVLLGLIATIRVPLRLLLPGAVVLGVLFLVLRPRPKKRPGTYRQTPV